MYYKLIVDVSRHIMLQYVAMIYISFSTHNPILYQIFK